MAKLRLNRINIVLAEFKFNQKDLAVYLKVSENTVSRWCRNENQPEIIKVYEIAKFFRIDHQTLYESTNWEHETNEPPYKVYLKEKAERKAEELKKIDKETLKKKR